MKRISKIMALMAFVALSACTHEGLESGYGVENEGVAGELVPMSFSTGCATRTSLDGNVVNWTADDEIVVFDDYHNGNRFTASSVDGPYAVFEGRVVARTTDFYAVYPCSSAIKATDESIYVNLIDNQTPVAGTFAEEHNISIAHATKAAEDDYVDNVLFRNICGLVQFTVPERLNAVVSVSFTANGRNIAGSLTVAKDDMSIAAYENAVSTVYMKGSFEAGSTFYFVVTPGEINGFNIKVTAENGATYTKTSAKTINVEAGKIRNLGVVDFTAQPYAVARHAYDAAGILIGTDVTLHLDLPAGMEEYVDGLTAYVVNSSNQEIRRVSKTSGVTASEKLEVRYGNVYIPHGTYKMYVTYSLNGVRKEETIAVDVPRPEFNVTVDAYTSYSKYRDGDIYAANYECNPETIYGMRCSVNISDDVLRQYGMSSCSVTLNNPYGSYLPLYGTVNKNSASCFYMEQQSVNAWGEYSLGAEVTFDGVTRTCYKTLYITGLPYTAAPPRNSGDYPWTVDHVPSGNTDIAWESDMVWFADQTASGEDCYRIGSPAFYVPAAINVYTSVSARGRKVGFEYNVDTRVYVGDGYYSFEAKYNNGNFSSYSNSSLSLNPSSSKVQIENREHTALNRLHVSSVTVLYR